MTIKIAIVVFLYRVTNLGVLLFCLIRSEREVKALKGEVETLNDQVGSLKTKLAGMHVRWKAERDLAAKRQEVIFKTYPMPCSL